MAKLILNDLFPLYVEYTPVGLEKYVEDELKGLGLPLGDGSLRVGLHTADEIVNRVGYAREADVSPGGITVEYERFIHFIGTTEISLKQFLKHIKDEENVVHQSLIFGGPVDEFLAISYYYGNIEVFDDKPLPMYRQIRKALLNLYGQYCKVSEEKDWYSSVKPEDMFRTALESFKAYIQKSN